MIMMICLGYILSMLCVYNSLFKVTGFAELGDAFDTKCGMFLQH